MFAGIFKNLIGVFSTNPWAVQVNTSGSFTVMLLAVFAAPLVIALIDFLVIFDCK